MSFYKANYYSELSRKNQAGRLLWSLVQCFFFQPGPRGLHRWRCFLLRLFGAEIGKQVCIYPGVRVYAPWNLILHDRSCLAERVHCYNVDKLVLKEDAVVSEGAFLCTASHDIDSHNRELITAPIVLEEGSWVFANAFIGPRVTVKRGGVIGACAVVTKDVPPFAVVVGNPAKFIKWRDKSSFLSVNESDEDKYVADESATD